MLLKSRTGRNFGRCYRHYFATAPSRRRPRTIPAEIDTYANLLYKAGRTREALEWQQKVVRLSAGRDPELTAHLDRMKAGLPTWTTP